MRLVFAAAALVALCASSAAQTRYVYIAPDDHTDYWWSADEATYQQVFLSTLDYYLNLADQTAGNPSAFRSRWNCDGSLWVWTYEHNRTPTQFNRLIGRIRDGTISMPLNPLCVSLGAAPLEAVLRGGYYAGRLERRYDLQFPLAYTMENQTQPLGLSALWAGCGARYSWKGICGCDSQVADASNRLYDIYWSVGPDGSRLLTKWNSMLQGNTAMGGYAEARSPSAIVDYVSQNAAFQARYPYLIIGCFGKGWDDVQTQTSEFVTVAQQKTQLGGASPRQVVVSNEVDFFQHFEQVYGGSLPSLAVSYGNEWELYCASLAEASARVKRAVEKLRAAEALATVVSIADPTFAGPGDAARDLAFMDLGLFWEHDFGMVGFAANHPWVTGRIAWQRRLAGEIETYVDALYEGARDALSNLIANPARENAGPIEVFGLVLSHPALAVPPRFYVFNPLGWERTDYADFDWTGAAPVRVVEVVSGLEAVSQRVLVNGVPRVRILAEDIPPVGYRVYELRAEEPTRLPHAATQLADGFVTQTHEVHVSPRGAVTSLRDVEQGNREFCATVGGRQMNDLGSSSGTTSFENLGAVSCTIVCQASAPVSHRTRLTVFRGIDRIEIENEILQNFSSNETWAFGFNLATPTVHHEEVGAVLHAALDSAGGDYAARNARYDWLTMNHFADIAGSDGAGATISNADCYFMRLGNSTANLLDTTTPQINVLAGGRVANGSNGLPAQGGDSYFRQRFALRTHAGYDPAAAMRFALEHQNPLVTGVVQGAKPRLPEGHYAGYWCSNPDVLLWSLKPADDGLGSGVVARLWNLTEQSQDAVLGSSDYFPLTAYAPISHIETDLSGETNVDASASLSFQPQQVRSLRVTPQQLKLPAPLQPESARRGAP